MRNFVSLISPPNCGASQLSECLVAGGYVNPEIKAKSAIANINKQMMSAIGVTRHNIPTYLNLGGMKGPASWLRETFLQDMEMAWLIDVEDSDLGIVLSCPSQSILSELWSEVARKNGFWCKSILVTCEPEVYASSEYKSAGSSFGESQSVWSRLMLASIRNSPLGTHILRYSDVLSAPVLALESVGLDGVGCQAPNSHSEVMFAAESSICAEDRIVLSKRLFNALSNAKLIDDLDSKAELCDSIDYLIRVGDEASGNVYALGDASAGRNKLQNKRHSIILHHHLFKNAGTSVDHILKQNFDQLWNEKEFKVPNRLSNSDLVRSYMIANSDYSVFSSHTGHGSLDFGIEDTSIYPIIFIRHPVLRALSAYDFEKKQTVETDGSILAKSNSFEDYIKVRLGRQNDYAFKNFQARRLAHFTGKRIIDLEKQSWATVESLPFIGLVEEFKKSMHEMALYLQGPFPDFKVYEAHKNVTSKVPKSIEEKLNEVSDLLGEETFMNLVRHNEIDISIHNYLCEKYKLVDA